MVSKKLFSVFLATLVLLSIVAGSSVAFAQNATTGNATKTATKNATKTATAKATQTIAQIAANNTTLTKFASLLKQANLTYVLNGSGNYTVFIPDNAAFSKVDPSTIAEWQKNNTTLGDVLKYHIVGSKFLSKDFPASGTLETLNGLRVPFSVDGTKIKVDNATVTKADINATNGVIHVIDSVMIPPTGTGTATASATANGGLLGLPGFEAIYAAAGLLVVAFLVIRRRK